MDYEKEYKKLKADIEKAYLFAQTDSTKAVLEHILPELAESEDEKIRKALIDYFDDANKADENPLELYGIHTDKVLAWLEKQGEQKPVDFKAKDWYVSKVDGKIHNMTYNPADKIEPKFKVDDWIVDNFGSIWKIEGIILNQFYILEDVEGGESRPTIEWVDKTCHLWTIQDAKDGDVLATDKGGVFIYAKVLYNKPYAYCGVDKFGVFKDNCLEHNWSNSVDNIHPATKEQRDLFFSKMKEAGYEWDAKKKIIRRFIRSTKPNDENATSIWSDEDEYMLNETIQHLEELIRIDKAKHCACDVQYYQRDIDWLKSLKDRVQPQWKPSEEHVRYLQAVVNDVHNIGSESCCIALKDLLEQLKKL